MQRTLAGLGLVVLLVLGGCSGDDDDASSDVVETTTTTAAGSTTTAAGPDGSPVSSEPESDPCLQAAEDGAPAMAAEAFPDNPDVEWAVDDVSSGDGIVVLIQVTPTPDEVGYPSFKLAVSCGTGEPIRLGTYAQEEEGWVLLSTTDAGGADALPAELP